MNRSVSLLFISLGLLMILVSCSLNTLTYVNDDDITIEHMEGSGDIRYTLDLGDNQADVFFSFTNVSGADESESPEVDERSIVINGRSFPAPVPYVFEVPEENRDSHQVFLEQSTRDLVLSPAKNGIRRDIFPAVGGPSLDVVDTGGDFNVLDPNDEIIQEAATCRSVVGPVSTDQGDRILNIWVADDCWWDGGTKSNLITAEMVSAIAEAFLQTGSDNDIYDWATGILGAEWGEHGYDNLIAPDGEVTILLSDIYDDYGYDFDGGGIVGYFWPVHNFLVSDYSGSNERIMFVIDAVMYANSSNDGSDGDATWETTDYWPRVVFSTLAHEFQHMIHFYQKAVLQGAGDTAETWIDEMCAMLIEDCLADKMGVEGPRGVSPDDGSAGSAGNMEGRIPTFNEYLFRSVLVDYPESFDLEDYSVSYALGAYLARSSGGAGFVRLVVCSPYMDKGAIEYAVRANTGERVSFEHLLERWGAAIFLSDMTAAPALYRYNTGGWLTTQVDGTEYKLGSINLYNYSTNSSNGPQYAASDQAFPADVEIGSNLYLLAGENVTGSMAWDISIPDDVRLTVILKGQ